MDAKLYTASGALFGWTRLPDAARAPRCLHVDGRVHFAYSGYFEGASATPEDRDRFWQYTEVEPTAITKIVRDRSALPVLKGE